MVFWFQGAPQLTENYLDSKKVINHRLLALLTWLHCIFCMLSIRHLHISHNAPYLPHKIFHKHCFNFSWDGCNTQEKWKTRVISIIKNPDILFIKTNLIIYLHFFPFKEVDVELRVVCEQFIQNVSESLIAPLSAFLAKVNKRVFWHVFASEFISSGFCNSML